jgi:hypothetical protein
MYFSVLMSWRDSLFYLPDALMGGRISGCSSRDDPNEGSKRNFSLHFENCAYVIRGETGSQAEE